MVINFCSSTSFIFYNIIYFIDYIFVTMFMIKERKLFIKSNQYNQPKHTECTHIDCNIFFILLLFQIIDSNLPAKHRGNKYISR